MPADRNAVDGKVKRKRAKCSSAETKQSKQKLTWSQIIKSNKNKGGNVTVCSCSIWGGSNCLCFVASSVLNVSYSFGVSSSKGFPPAQTICKVTMDWHKRLEDLFLNTFFPQLYWLFIFIALNNCNHITSGQNSGSPTCYILLCLKSFWHSWEHKPTVGQEEGKVLRAWATRLEGSCCRSETTKPLLWT